MPRHTVKRIEIIIDRPLLHKAIQELKDLGASRYSVLPAVQGRGKHHSWDADELFGGDQKVVLLALVSIETGEKIITRFEELLEHFSCVLSAWDVEVVRRDRFS